MTPIADRSVITITNDLGVTLSEAQALQILHQADYVLLGEVHDNPVHHTLRAALLSALATRRPTVVFEQFSRGRDSALAAPVGTDFDAWLDRTGFDRKGWAWPLHRPLIDAALAHGLAIRGGNLERDEVRQISREGIAAAPGDLAMRLAEPLPAAAAEVLGQSLIDGHCGQLPAAAVPRMRGAQAARDVSMADALMRAASQTGRPAMLIAGNGHVRKDHGVPLWLARFQPAARVVSVGFLEVGADGKLPPSKQRMAFDLVWVTQGADRPDPCAGFSPPARSPAPAASVTPWAGATTLALP